MTIRIISEKTIQTPAEETIEFRKTLPFIPQNRKLRNGYRGCLLGGAVGDALGYPVAFLSRGQILSRYGEKGIRDYPDGKGLISDDTQIKRDFDLCKGCWSPGYV